MITQEDHTNAKIAGAVARINKAPYTNYTLVLPDLQADWKAGYRTQQARDQFIKGAGK